MSGSPTVATLTVYLPLAKAEAEEAVRKVFPDDDAALRSSLFYAKYQARSDYLISAYSKPDEYILLVHYQGERSPTPQRVVTTVEVTVEPGLGTSIRKSADRVWEHLEGATQLLQGKNRPALERAEVKMGGATILAGGPPSTRDLIVGSTELRLPVLAGAISVIMLALTLPLGLVPTEQVPAMWWVVIQLIIPAFVAAGVAYVSNRRKGIVWRIE